MIFESGQWSQFEFDFPEPASSVSVRNIIRNLYRSRYALPSRSLNAMLYAESALERDAYVLLDFLLAGGVAADVIPQPYTIRYQCGESKRRYTPDCLLELSSVRTALEFKPQFQLAKASVYRKLVEVAPSVLARNHRFIVWTEVPIRREPRLTQLKQLRAEMWTVPTRDALRTLCLQNYEHIQSILDDLGVPRDKQREWAQQGGAPRRRGPQHDFVRVEVRDALYH